MRTVCGAVNLIVLAGLCTFAQQSTDYLIVDAPIGTQSASKALWVKWAGSSRGAEFPAPDSGIIYYDRSPGGGNLANYRYKIAKPFVDTSIKTADSIRDNIYFQSGISDPVAKRGTAFRAADQTGMGFGVFYCVVAFPAENDTFVSNEFQLMIETPDPVEWVGPTGTISSSTPTFQWKANAGVPYYYVILSDDVISIDSSSGTVDIEGVRIIWEAITPSTKIVYGASYPSGTITASPPPLSPGQRYTWFVLNNYGNHPAFSSAKIKIPVGEFTVKGESLAKPECVYPVDVRLNSEDNGNVVFKWKNLDSAANTYKLYIYVGSDFEGVEAQLVVYETEVVGDGRGGENEIDSVELNAASILAGNSYGWRVIAVNEEGAGTSGDLADFQYDAPTGTMKIYTKEQIIVGSSDDPDIVINPVGLVEIKVEVLSGSLEAPLLFYSNDDGILNRQRPAGTYRVTAIKSEYEKQTKTITVRDGQTITETFYLERPEATVFGKVVDEAGKGINIATVYGLSDRGDTVSTESNSLGDFVLNCYAADWRIVVEKTGYQSSLQKKVTVKSANNVDFGTVILHKNPFTLSGTVKNSSGALLLGASVQIFQNGTMLSKIPSTPQNGTFSFTVAAGTYTILAEKSGFTSYSRTIDVLGSKSLTVTMHAGATLVTGYIYGKTFVEGRETLAPITGARVVFVARGSSDSLSVTSDITYGDFRVSLPGGKEYSMFATAFGFVHKSTPVLFTTLEKSTQSVFDTLQGLGMVSGIVQTSSGGAAISGANITLVSISGNTVSATGKSSFGGSFELRGIPDGKYSFHAGREGLVLDSVSGNDTFTVSNGASDRATVRLYLKPGDKTVRWNIHGGVGDSLIIKIQSPLIRTVRADDSLTGAGSGLYLVSVDAKPDSIIDISYHRFTVADMEVTHVDTVSLDVVSPLHDSLLPHDGKVTLTLRSSVPLDSAAIFYKDAVGRTFTEMRMTEDDTLYTFSLSPPRDGSFMQYYFSAWRGNDVYGYDKEVRVTYIKPDFVTLTRFEIVPSSDDTLLFPSKYKASFRMRGYVSSAFIEDTSINGSAVTWSLVNAQGSSISDSKGLSTSVTTGRKATTSVVELKVTLDTTRVSLADGLLPQARIYFTVSGSSIKNLNVARIDAASSDPITTSSTDQAEFAADGRDERGKNVNVTPQWSIVPRDAGVISTDGVFKPRRNFAGTVRIIAVSGSVSGEYVDEAGSAPGLTVHFMITNRTTADTARNGIGCDVIFPSGVVDAGDIGLLEIAPTKLENHYKRGFGLIRTVDTVGFEINQLTNTSLNTSADSIRLKLTVPESLRKRAASGSGNLAVAQWIDDSLVWRPLANSKVSADGNSVIAALGHFSLYCLVYEPSDNLAIDIAPNPFSPYIVPPYDPFNSDDRTMQHNGICIRVQADSRSTRSEVRLRIYNVLGNQVWSFVLQNADNLPYYVWWDGRTSAKDILSEGSSRVFVPKGVKMCRNGRYFALLSAKVNGKERRVMKQIILMK